MKELLEIEHLKVKFRSYAGEVHAVRDVSLSVKEGEIVAIVGESGCGKSVTAKSVMGLINCPPGEIDSNSHILYDGDDILKFSEKEWEEYRGGKCAMVFQDALASLNPTLTVGKQIAENLTIHGIASGKQAERQALNLLKQVGISQAEKRIRQYPHQFSGGMRQRVMIAIALACNPKLLIADEPTTSLDVTIQAQILDLICSLQRQNGMSVVLITHDLGIVAGFADRVFVMYSGEVIEEGSVQEIFYQTRHPYTKALLDVAPRIDKQTRRMLPATAGSPPDLIVSIKGCPFAPRCRYCMQICTERVPQRFVFSQTHSCSCWMHHEYAPSFGPAGERDDIDIKRGIR